MNELGQLDGKRAVKGRVGQARVRLGQLIAGESGKEAGDLQDISPQPSPLASPLTNFGSQEGSSSSSASPHHHPANGSLSSGSEQQLGRLLERMDNVERELRLLHRIFWRTSAALVGLALAGTSWEWVAHILRLIGG